MVSVGRWSVIGGEIVPAVTLVAVIVVSVGPMSVAELYAGLFEFIVYLIVPLQHVLHEAVN